MKCQGDIFDNGRKCKIRVFRASSMTGSRFHEMPHFSVGGTNGGMAFPEVLRAYARLFTKAADKAEGIEPIDFQI